MEQRGLMEPPERGSQIELGPMDTLEKMEDFDAFFAVLDRADLEEAMKSCTLQVVKVPVVQKAAAKAVHARRGYYEVQITIKHGPTFAVEAGGRGDKYWVAEAAKDITASPTSALIEMDELHGGKEGRTVLMAALAAEQRRRTGFQFWDEVETNQLLEWKRALDPRVLKEDEESFEELVIPPGAAGVVKNVWLGTQRGVLVAAGGDSDLVLNLEPGQLNLVEGDGMFRRLFAEGMFVMNPKGGWHRVPRPTLG